MGPLSTSPGKVRPRTSACSKPSSSRSAWLNCPERKRQQYSRLDHQSPAEVLRRILKRLRLVWQFWRKQDGAHSASEFAVGKALCVSLKRSLVETCQHSVQLIDSVRETRFSGFAVQDPSRQFCAWNSFQ